jgi:CheY-like chemotaxis protein
MTRVLVHEPDPELFELFSRLVARLGYVPVQAPDERVDAALVETSDAAGREVIASLRSGRPHLPVVCVSVYPLDDEVAALAPAAYLTKPVSKAGLGDALAAALAPVAQLS